MLSHNSCDANSRKLSFVLSHFLRAKLIRGSYLSCGLKRQGGDPAGASAEEAPMTPRGKRSAS
ncbi:hypothetical protein D1B31_20335 [Neobacillus notoginsengisoli]|uniref:Uncharacterized protein n=1 Tax=Neobacillus notoginsengisoli TaxID=1578198 RepID=A0A417YKW2_9BACI|nr:hypothetical protein D1B31_20335 [Neobacillus notoginsengisoli]